MSETNLVIQYQGKQIGLYSDDRNDYINLTEMAVANGSRKYIKSWMNNKQTLLFLCAWESKNNPKFTGAEKMPSLLEGIAQRELSIQYTPYITKNGVRIWHPKGKMYKIPCCCSKH